MRRTFLSHERLKEILHYDPSTGVFTRIVGGDKRAHNRFAGKIAGTKQNAGYWSISIRGDGYLAHRLAWFYVHGEWPEFIDHVDGNRRNNALVNLRVCTKETNAINAKIPSNNKTGAKGVSWHRRAQKYIAQLGPKYLGLFDNIPDASAAYRAAALESYGDFVRSE